MMNNEKITQEQVISDESLKQNVHLIIDLHGIMVRANENFIFTKKLSKLAVKMSTEIARLEPKCVTLKAV